MPELTIRFARADEGSRLLKIEDAADSLFADLGKTLPWSRAELRSPTNGFILVAVEPSDLEVGFAHVGEVRGFAHLEQLSVLPNRGRRGIGRQLLMEIMRLAKQRGHQRITLRTFRDVPWKGPFYKTYGFTEEAPATDFHAYSLLRNSRLDSRTWGAECRWSRRSSPRWPVSAASCS